MRYAQKKTNTGLNWIGKRFVLWVLLFVLCVCWVYWGCCLSFVHNLENGDGLFDIQSIDCGLEHGVCLRVITCGNDGHLMMSW